MHVGYPQYVMVPPGTNVNNTGQIILLLKEILEIGLTTELRNMGIRVVVQDSRRMESVIAACPHTEIMTIQRQ